jgi:mycothiol synthase
MLRIETASRLGDEVLTNLQALIGAATLADGHEPLGEHKFLRIQRGDDLANAVLAFDGDRLAGYAHTLTYATADERRTSCEIVVHPECRGLGVGRSLLAGVVDAARDQHARRVDLWAYNHSPLRSGAAQDAGFRPVRKLMHLHRHMRKLPRVEPRDGVVVRTFRPGSDEAPWLYLNRRVFEAHPDQAHWTGEDLRARMAQPWFEPADFLLAERDGEIVAFNWVKIEPRETEGRVGEIYVVGVAPEAQGHGLGALLLAHGLRRMRDRNADIAAIYVDESNTRAIDLYTSMAFHHHHVDVCYTLPLGDAGALPDESAA